MKRFLALFFAHKKWVRKWIGGRWVCDSRHTNYAHCWVQFNDLAKYDGGMSDFEAFQAMPPGLIKEDYTAYRSASQGAEGMIGDLLELSRRNEELDKEILALKGVHGYVSEDGARLKKAFAKIESLEEELAAYRAALEKVRNAIIVNAQDTLWFSKYETCVDFINSFLSQQSGGSHG